MLKKIGEITPPCNCVNHNPGDRYVVHIVFRSKVDTIQ